MANQSVKSKVVSGSTKKRSSSKLNKRTALFALTGILAFSTIAGIGWQKWQDHQLKAKAAGWTNTYAVCYGGGCTYAKVCKVAITSAYGPLWQFSHYVSNTSKDTITSYFRTKRGASVVGTSTVYSTPPSYRFGSYLYGSRIYNDTFEYRIAGYQNGQYIDSGYVWMPIDSIAYC